MVWVRKRNISTEWPPLVGEVIAKFADRGCHVVSVMDPYGRILRFLDKSRYFSIKYSFLNRCQLLLKHMPSGNFIFTYGFCNTVLIALTLSHEQIHILSPLPILISLLSTGRNVLHRGFSLPPSPYICVNITLSSCHENYHILELISENNKCTHCHVAVVLNISHSPSDIYFVHDVSEFVLAIFPKLIFFNQTEKKINAQHIC
jgi:hypothetical protein